MKKQNNATTPSGLAMNCARFIGLGVIMLSVVLSLSLTTSAQTMTSTAELKLACETSPGNVVMINQNTQISTGQRPPFTEAVNTKCTIVIAPLATFEASQVSLTFNGPLAVQGGTEARALFIESEFIAPSASVSLMDLGFLQVERSLLKASAGGIAISSGSASTVEIKGPLVGGNLVASGAISISGGQRFIGLLADAELRAGSGMTVSMTGAETQFVANASTLNTTNGSISISANGEYSFAEFKLGSVATAGNGLSVVLSGNESKINANQFTLNSGSGSATLRANGSKGSVILALGTLSAGGAVTINASTAGSEGNALVDSAQINAGGNLRVESGGFGKSEVKDSGLTSPTLVRIATGAGGNCSSVGNTISAPVQQICP